MMNLDGILSFARLLLEKVISKGAIVVDATAGNGHDTLFLAKLVGKNGRVYAFDIQQEAIDTTKARLRAENELDQVVLIQKGHETVKTSIEKSHHQQIAAAIFNLGYLPGGDKNIVTKPETTVAAIKELLALLKVGGLIILVIYHGHQEGKQERDALIEFAKQLPQTEALVLQYQFINQTNNPPFIIAIEKR